MTNLLEASWKGGNMPLTQNKKAQGSLVVILLLLLLFVGQMNRTEAASRYYTDAQMKRKYGTYYSLFTISKLKISKGKLVVTGKLMNQNSIILKKKKRTFKLAKKMKEYLYFEENLAWRFEGTRSRSTFKRWLKSDKEIHFPAVHIWVKKGKITAFGLSD